MPLMGISEWLEVIPRPNPSSLKEFEWGNLPPGADVDRVALDIR